MTLTPSQLARVTDATADALHELLAAAVVDAVTEGIECQCLPREERDPAAMVRACSFLSELVGELGCYGKGEDGGVGVTRRRAMGEGWPNGHRARDVLRPRPCPPPL